MITTETACNRAIKASQRDGRLRFVLATAYGPKTTLRRVEFQGCFWTNGQEYGFWEAHAPSGETKGRVAP